MPTHTTTTKVQGRSRFGLKINGWRVRERRRRREDEEGQDSPLAAAIRAWSCSASVGGCGQGPVPMATSGPPVALRQENKTKEGKSSSINVSCPLRARVRLTGLTFGALGCKDKAADSDVKSLATPQQIEHGECVVYRTGWQGKQRCTVDCTLPGAACANYLHSLAAAAAPSSKST